MLPIRTLHGSFALVLLVAVVSVSSTTRLSVAAPGRQELITVAATDSVFEDKVVITWPHSAQPNTFYRVKRGVDLLSVVSSQDSTFADFTGIPGTVYVYTIQMINVATNVQIDIGSDNGSRVIAAPTGVTATDGTLADKVLVAWNDRSIVEAGYKIYRDGVLVGTTTVNQEAWSDTAAVTGTTYTYCVRAFDAGGNMSQGRCDAGLRGIILPPGAFRASDGQYSQYVALTWTDPTTGESGFNLYRDNALLVTLAPNTTAFNDSTAPVGVVHQYCLKTVKNGNQESVASCDEGGRGTLAAPGTVTASDFLHDDRVEITWSDLAETEDGFKVYQGGTLIATTAANVTKYTDRSGVPGTTYAYCVRAFSNGGAESAPVCDDGTRAVVTAPTRVQATDGTFEDRVLIQWQSAATRAVLFKLYRDGVAFTTVAATVHGVEDVQIPSGGSHQYCVTAVTADEVESSQSCDTGFRTISPPTSVAASDDQFETHVMITWDDNSNAETGYLIERKTGNAAFETLATRGANRSAYIDSTGVPGTVYTYRVSAFDALGTSASNEDDGSRVLNAPQSVEATDGAYENKIIVTWLDKSIAEKGYRVYRRIGAGAETLLGTTAKSATSFKDSVGVAFGTVYTYRVAGFDNYGPSPSAEDEGSTAMLAPTSVNASDSYLDRATVSWIDNSTIEQGYRIYRNGTLIHTTGANVSSFTDLTGTAGITYEYCVRTYSGSAQSVNVCDSGGRALPPAVTYETRQAPVKLVASDARSNRDFGTAVAIDGNYVMVGAPEVLTYGKGAVYVFARDATTRAWEQIQKFAPSTLINGDLFGYSIAMKNGWAAVAVPKGNGDLGTVLVYRLNTTTKQYELAQEILPPIVRGTSMLYGYALAMDENYIVAGSPTGATTGGTVFVWKLDTSTNQWGYLQELVNPAPGVNDWYGVAVAVRNGVIVAGASNANGGAGSARVWRLNGNTWQHEQEIYQVEVGTDLYGSAVAFDGESILVSDDNYAGTGKVWIWQRVSNVWQRVNSFMDPRGGSMNRFGCSLASDGSRSIVGVSSERSITYPSQQDGAAYLIDPSDLANPFRLRFEPRDAVGADFIFGTSVALQGAIMVFGAPGEDQGGSSSGAVYVYEALTAPGSVEASDGTFDKRVQINWQDLSDAEDGFHIYRDGQLIETVGPNTSSYGDFEGEPGRIYDYAVSAFSAGAGETGTVADLGWRPPDGNITGRVSTRAGGGVEGVQVCLDPPRASALQFDGSLGHLIVSKMAQPALSELTVEFWVKTNDTVNDGTPFSYYAGTESNALTVYNTRNLQFSLNGGSVTTGVAVNDNKWHHVAFKWRNSDGQVRLLVDGVVRYTGTGLRVGHTVATGGTLVLGQEQDTPGGGFEATQAFQGELDDVRLWSTARPDSEIAAGLDQPVDPAASGLVFYMPLDEALGTAAADLTGNAGYGLLKNGTFWSQDTPPLHICATTDLEGNYALGGIRYGQSTTFKVTPDLGVHQFEPAFKSITLSTGSPVQNEVAFNDISSFTLSGDVLFTQTTCPEEGVEILVDDMMVGTTNGEGSFAVAAGFGTHTLKMRKGGNTFSPASRTIDVQHDIGLLDFQDTTHRTLAGRVGGGCNLPIGMVHLEVRTENGCFVTADSTVDTYMLRLSPQKYVVRVTDVTGVPAVLDRADILEFFETLGPRSVDLTTSNQEQDLIYRAPLQIRITGFTAPSCNTLTLPDNTVVPAVPILAQCDRVPLTIEVYEDYGNGNHCPVDSGVVSIFDEIIDEQDTPVQLVIRDGKVEYETAANTPNVFPGRIDQNGNNRSYQKPITAVAQVEGLAAAGATEWVMVSGHRPRTATFTSVSEEVPLLILRDPPGDASSSSLEKGTKICTHIKNFGLENVSTGLKTKAKGGMRFSKGTPFWSSETEFGLETENNFKIGFEATQEGGVDICGETTEKFSTSTDDSWLGGDGDLFMGVAMNLVFAKTDVLDIQGCTVSRSEAITMGGDGFQSTYVYTAEHLRDVLIPQLEELAQLQPDQAYYYNSAAQNWRNQLSLNDSLKAIATFRENKSFSAGADYEFSESIERTGGFNWTTKVFTSNELALGFVFNETGSGVTNQFALNFQFEYEHGGGQDTTTITKVGYTLTDDDIYDFFTVDVLDDKTYATPVFKTVSGRSSCPWEPNTQPRDGVEVRIEPPVQENVDPEGVAQFTLSITNLSEADEQREYFIQPVQTTNSDGAGILLAGNTFQQLAVFLEPGQTHSWKMSVARGPDKYRYDDIGITVIPTCQFDYWRKTGVVQLADTAFFSVHYQAPCSDITLFEPKGGWSYNLAQSLAAPVDQIRLTLNDFKLQISETDSIQAIGAEYRAAGTDVWFPIQEIAKDSLEEGHSEQILWNVAGVPDGSYEVRAFTRCQAGRTYSRAASGVIDRKRPLVFGTPQPADSLLSLGDEISITFDEPIKCTSVTSQHVILEVLNQDQTIDSVQVATACDGRTVIITPVNPAYPLLEGKKLRVRVRGITDLLGNPMAGPNSSSEVVWRTDVRRNVFTWREISVSKEAPYRNPGSIEATLVNGTGSPVNFTITGLPAWLTAVPSSGNIGSGETMLIRLDISPTIAIGANNASLEYNAVITANVASPPIASPLAVKVKVVCVKPDWVVNAGDFEQSMSVVARLTIGNVIQTDPNDRIAAFVGNQLRGVASPVWQPALSSWLTFLTVYSNRASGENVRFQVWDDSDCRLYTGTNRTIRFEAEKRQGTTSVPEVLNATDLPASTEQLIPVNAGWTWISLNLLSPTDMTLSGVLGDLNPATGDIAKSQTSFSQFDPGTGWVGTLADFNNTSGYSLKLSQAGTIIHEGSPVSVTATSVPVMNGWNWVGYLPQITQPVNTALSLLAPQHGDVIKSQTQFAQYVKAGSLVGWFGDLATMNPGLGYRLFLSNASIIQNQFKYYAPAVAPPATMPLSIGDAVVAAGSLKEAGTPQIEGLSGPDGDGGAESASIAAARARIGALLAPKSMGPGWEVNPRDYSMNMTLTGRLEIDGVPLGDENDVVAAFVGDEVRGLAQPQSVPGLNQYLVFLMVYGNEGDHGEVTFRLFDSDLNQVIGIANAITYEPDKVTGTVISPYALQVTGAPGGDPNRPTAFSLAQNYPNPPNGSTVIRYALPAQEHVLLRVFDVAGREVVKLVDQSQPAGRYDVTFDVTGLANGLYFYRLQAGPFSGVHKLMVVN